jgi:hypothetical protein
MKCPDPETFAIRIKAERQRLGLTYRYQGIRWEPPAPGKSFDGAIDTIKSGG